MTRIKRYPVYFRFYLNFELDWELLQEKLDLDYFELELYLDSYPLLELAPWVEFVPLLVTTIHPGFQSTPKIRIRIRIH